MTPHKKIYDTDESTRYACLVNRTKVIDTLEAKANLIGFKYIRRKTINTDLVEKTDKKGKFLYYSQTLPFDLLDVDGKIKKSVKTSYYKSDKVTEHKKPAIGTYDGKLAGTYHGRKSENWKQEYLTLNEIIDILNAGYSITPGEFNPPKGKSARSAEYCTSRQFILFDGDEWTPDHPAPADISELIERYPNLTTDFFWTGESISSRSSLKPELRLRLMLVLPTPIRQAETNLWQTVIDTIVSKYPFIAHGVGIDQVRLSFGNARPECENRILNGFISQKTFENWKQTATEKEKQDELDAQEKKKQRERQEKARREKQKIQIELHKRGYAITETKCPIVDFNETDPATLLTNHGIATHLHGKDWNYTGSGAGKSLELENGIIKPFSEQAQKASPEKDDPTEVVNAHRYIAYILFNLDMKVDTDKRQLRCELANIGYGTHPDEYAKHQKKFKRLARNEGLLTPLTAEQRLFIDTEQNITSENINVIRLQNDKRFQDWIKRTETTQDIDDTDETTEKQHILIISTGAGTGKTTLTILKLEKSVDISPITELADDKFEKAIAQGKDAVRHRPRHYNRSATGKTHTKTLGLDGGDTVPCVYPDHCNALAKRGYNPITTFCNRCPRKDECDEQGYLSQYRTLSMHNQIYFAWNEGLLTDPHSRKYIRKLTENGDYVGVLDEVDPADLCPQRTYTKQLLEQIFAEFRFIDSETTSFLRGFIRETATVTNELEWTQTVREILEIYDRETLQEIDDDLQKIPVVIKFSKEKNPPTNYRDRPVYRHNAHISYKDKTITAAVLNDPDDSHFLESQKWITKGEVLPDKFNYTDEYPTLLTVNSFIRLGFASLQTPESINMLPRRLFEFATDLKTFVDNTKSETPPARRTAVGYDYYLPPSLNMRRAVFISASGVVDMIKELYKETEIDIEIIDGKPPEWKQGCKLYQISTGRYTPNQSLIEKQDGIPTGLKQRAIDMLNIIEKTATASPDKKVLVVAPKAFTESGELADQPELKRIHALPNVDMINHAHAEGVNTYEHHEISFVFGYEIPPDELESIARRIYRNHTLSFEREKTDIKKGGVILKDVERYKDPRVQAVHDKTCEAILMQAITRQRQMLYENHICYLLTSEPVSGLPTTTILFTLADMFYCLETHGTLDKLDTFIEKQAERTPKEVSEQENVTERTARRRTTEKRKDEKEKSARQVFELRQQGNSIRKIVEITGFSQGKVQNMLRKNGTEK